MTSRAVWLFARVFVLCAQVGERGACGYRRGGRGKTSEGIAGMVKTLASTLAW